jgi:hypothetical protein
MVVVLTLAARAAALTEIGLNRAQTWTLERSLEEPCVKLGGAAFGRPIGFVKRSINDPAR